MPVTPEPFSRPERQITIARTCDRNKALRRAEGGKSDVGAVEVSSPTTRRSKLLELTKEKKNR